MPNPILLLLLLLLLQPLLLLLLPHPGGSDYKLIYRHYATLYFVFCVDSSESELGILDLIQVPASPGVIIIINHHHHHPSVILSSSRWTGSPLVIIRHPVRHRLLSGFCGDVGQVL